MGPGGAEGPRTTHASAARLGHGHWRHAAEGEMPLPGAFCWAQYVLKTFKPQDFSDGLPSGRGVLPTREGGAASLLLAAPPKPRRPPQVRPAVSRDRAWGLGALSESGPAGPRRGGAERGRWGPLGCRRGGGVGGVAAAAVMAASVVPESDRYRSLRRQRRSRPCLRSPRGRAGRGQASASAWASARHGLGPPDRLLSFRAASAGPCRC